MEVPTLPEVLDHIVEDIMKEFPEKNEFEAAFFAANMHISALTQMMAQSGMDHLSLTEQELYSACWNLAELNKWMAAKLLTAETMRQIEDM